MKDKEKNNKNILEKLSYLEELCVGMQSRNSDFEKIHICKDCLNK